MEEKFKRLDNREIDWIAYYQKYTRGELLDAIQHCFKFQQSLMYRVIAEPMIFEVLVRLLIQSQRRLDTIIQILLEGTYRSKADESQKTDK